MESAEPRPPVRTLDRLLTANELADYLGVPIATLYTWRYRNEGPPGFRIGRHLRYRRGDVEKWIRQQMNGPQP